MSGLFEPEPTETDHPAYMHLRSTEFRPEIREWCEETYAKVAGQLDPDFCDRFRREIPQRLSELFFAAAFLEAGWEPIGRVKGFDLAYELGEGRLLIEITTPAPPSPDTYVTEERDGMISWSTDEGSEDAALRRLTGGFTTKAELIRSLPEGALRAEDYVVIALSGLRLSQESPTCPDIGGNMPQFAKAFLPIGSLYVTFRIGDGADGAPTESGYQYKETIDQKGMATVDRKFFLGPDFQHIDAVAYTPFHLGGPDDGPPQPTRQCAVLHNPTARRGKDPARLKVGDEYLVKVGENHFTIERL